jgi:hypothetical protein
MNVFANKELMKFQRIVMLIKFANIAVTLVALAIVIYYLQ